MPGTNRLKTVLFGMLLLATQTACAKLEIDKDLPAGNIFVTGVTNDTVCLQNEMRDTSGWWFYWAFRVRGAEGRTLTFKFVNGSPVGTRGPCVSTDQGATWRYLSDGYTQSQFRYAFAATETEVWFAMGMVYTQRNWDGFMKKMAGSPFLETGTLTRSRKGREVEKVRLGCIASEPRQRVLLTARHHCCEMMASYVLEGIVEGVLADDEKGKWLRGNVEFLVIPFVDKDGVEDGDQGKNRKPHDHARDYRGDSLHTETAAIRTQVPIWAKGKLDVVLDLHCPWIRGRYNEWVYQVGNPVMAVRPEYWEQQAAFGQLLENVEPNVLSYRQADDLPFGKAWHTAANYTQGITLYNWATVELAGVRLAGAFEIPFATANGTEVNATTARQFGKNMAVALWAYLQKQGGER